MNKNIVHQSVMKSEVINFFQVEKGAWYVDATLGAGGHAKAIALQGGQVIGIDRDDVALEISRERLNGLPVTLIKGSFADLEVLIKKTTRSEIDGILFDFGVSSMQFDTPARGFSFRADAPLDMRMDQSDAITAADIVNNASQKELYVLFTTLAQEKRARSISEAIVRARVIKPITTTGELVHIIEDVTPKQFGGIHPATLPFQALRMAVNKEIDQIQSALPQAVKCLRSGGKLITISFHEGEDRIVKQFIKRKVAEEVLIPLTKHALLPSEQEIMNNPRARSAKLRVAYKK